MSDDDDTNGSDIDLGNYSIEIVFPEKLSPEKEIELVAKIEKLLKEEDVKYLRVHIWTSPSSN